MVTVTNYKKRMRLDGTHFFVLEVSGGIEFLQSETTGNYYATSKTCTIPTTFSDSVCRNLMGTAIPGNIVKVECDPYSYTIKETGEEVILTHRYMFVPDEKEQEKTLEKELVNQE